MARRRSSSALTRSLTRSWTKATQRNLSVLTRLALGNGQRVVKAATKKTAKAVAAKRKPPPGAGDWLAGMAFGAGGTRGYHLYRPPGLKPAFGQRVPLLVMLHGCGQTGSEFAASTRMNRIAARHGFLVLYPEQDRLHHPQGCWDWYDTRSGKAEREAATLMAMIDQIVMLYGADRDRIAVAGLSAGAGMAALLASSHPQRFVAVAMHSGVAPGAAQSSATALRAMQGLRAPAMPITAVGKAMHAAERGTVLPPMLVMHGEADRVVAASNAASAAKVWAAATGAKARAERTVQRGQRHAMRVTDFRVAGRTSVRLCEVKGLGHAWSGGLASQSFGDAKGPDASALIWAFIAPLMRAAD